MEITQMPFGKTKRGEAVTLWRIADTDGSCAEFLDYGCTLHALRVPDRSGHLTDVVLGYDTAEEYEAHDGCVGATPGRFANRIGGAAFTLNGKDYPLAANDGENHLHGGLRGFDKRLWRGEALADGVRFSRTSPDGEEGYPGTLHASVTVRWSGKGGLSLTYEADSDTDTIINLTSHAYFNLNGQGDVLGHRLQLQADTFTENDAACLPTGRILPVAGTPLDFRQEKAIGQDIDADDICVKQCGGYDINLVLNGTSPAAVLYAPESGIRMTLTTDQPGVQLYSANSLTPRTGKGGAAYAPRSGVCLETQVFPDAIHHPDFPSCVLKAGERYVRHAVFAFSHD
ncbi:MAG: galactose mutarotase [Oscillibacter sp.]|jgi:aldose 1-epimerase|nr:galactose mutarotase [Oscillibacter sp.]